MATSTRVLLLPGWQNSSPDHWQSRWELLHGDQRVTQDDWLWPRRGDWMARLEEVLLECDRPSVLVAHSLGCHLVAAWAAHSKAIARVSAALLVAPPDTERDDTPPQLFNWRPMVRERLPFPSTVVASGNDVYCSVAQATELALGWGSTLWMLGEAGHINGDSALGDWSEGRRSLEALVATA